MKLKIFRDGKNPIIFFNFSDEQAANVNKPTTNFELELEMYL
jgi:hypothetical protein